jgi:hypothetical protein
MDLLWTKIVTRFVSKDFTFPINKLPALASITIHYAKLHKLTYVTGHWKQNLAEDLL